MQKRRKKRVGSIERTMLHELSAGDMLYGFLLSRHSTHRMFRLAEERAAYRYRQKRALERLMRNGLVKVKGEKYSLTEKGAHVAAFAIGKTRAKLAHKWDGKWRIVAFDIPQEHARIRSRLRGILKGAGFLKLQQSIWVFPHDCAELISFINEEPMLAPYILYGVFEKMNNDSRFRKLFKL